MKITGCSAAAINSVINISLDGLRESNHRARRGQPRVVVRSDAESIVIGLQLLGTGQTHEAIKAVILRSEIKRILAGRARLLVLEASGVLSAFDEISGELLQAMKAQNSMPIIMVDLRSIREKVEAAIEYCAVHRWGFDKSKLGQIAKSQAEIMAKRDAFIARQKAPV